MDAATAQYYVTHAQELAARYDAVVSPLARLYPLAFPAGSRVLDVGAGSGRDMAALLHAGYDAFGMEPCEGLRLFAEQAHSEINGRLVQALLPTNDSPFGGDFDGILCCAVLMHVPESDLFDAALSIRRLLKPHGRILLSLPSARSDVGGDERDEGGGFSKPTRPSTSSSCSSAWVSSS